MEKITAVLPVKANSERLPNKNNHKFLNTTLLEHKLEQLRDVPFDKIIVSSEDASILGIADFHGYEFHKRDPKYSTPDVPMSEVYRHIASEVEGDHIAWINVPSPLVGTHIYKDALKTFREMPAYYNCLLSCYNLQKYVMWKDKPLNFNPYPWVQSQTLKGLYALSFAINIRHRTDIIKYGTLVGDRPYLYMIDPITSTKIDYKHDLDFCEIIWKQRQKDEIENRKIMGTFE